MTNLPGLNYSWMTLANNKQLGSDKKAKDEQFELKDGLSKKDLQNIDKKYGNKDGSISEAEFKTAYSQKYGENDKNYKQYWNNYVEAFNNLGGKAEDIYENGKRIGKKITTTRPYGKEIVSYYDTKGNMIKYTETKTDDKTGTKTSITYKYNEEKGGLAKDIVETVDKKGKKERILYEYSKETGKVEQTKKIITNANGNIYREKDGIVRKYSGENKKYRVSTIGDKVEYIKAGDLKYNIKWNGNDATVVINEKECKGTLINGEITFKYNGKALGELKKLDNGLTGFFVYNNDGKKEKSFTIDKNGYIIAENTFNKYEDIVKTEIPQTGEITNYSYEYEKVDSKIIKKKCTVYQDDNKTKKTTTNYKQVNGKTVISTVDFYDENGKIKETVQTNTGDPFGDSIIQTAFKYLEYKEADGSYEIFDKKIGGWCADFVSYVANEVCKDKGINEKKLEEIETLLGNTIVQLTAAGKSANKYYDFDYKTKEEKYDKKRIDDVGCKIKRGMAFTIKPSVDSTGRHIGIVVDVDLKNGTFTTIEGNNKDEVRHNTRKIENIVGLIDLSFIDI